ncbi:adenylate cyclase [Ferrimonas balearica DSM 9799]|uniref:Adenylate cyclase n=1 Tax=Ferrimonas balearica (strain DSM 9799 / CCM 4581 / KCTC 23876 / PAT) TaxID=550540 RepID=E1SQF6_FERBD|nr:CYTH domain-containing protein [Ferrimonas balearica]ADN74768.1 adenylate cyclase [Ferrimonas balearica DSM 9799]
MEVELKLLLAPETPVGALSSLEFPAALTQIKRASLGNAYFDTPDLALRQRDMGLRIRRRGDFREQTLKTAGRVEGGLHARPEYNTEVSGECPQLERFPDTLWSEKDREAIQSALAVQFHTDFERQQGELSLADGVRVELALDSGTIRAGERSEVIAELELELISGEASALMPLARHLMSQWPLRLGLDSKAARGYRLAGLAPWPEVVENAATQPLALLAAWQRNEERLLAGELAAAAPMSAQLQAVVTLLGESAEGLRPLVQALQGDAPRQALQAALGSTEYGLIQLSLLALSLD